MSDNKESPRDMLFRVASMASGNEKWDLSDNDRRALQWVYNQLPESVVDAPSRTPVQRFVEWVLTRDSQAMLDTAQIATLAEIWGPGEPMLPRFLLSLGDGMWTPTSLRSSAAEWETTPPLETAEDCLRALLEEFSVDALDVSVEEHQGAYDAARFRRVIGRARALLDAEGHHCSATCPCAHP